MSALLIAILFFVGIHIVVSGTALRGVVVDLIAERVYAVLFSLASVGGLLAMIWTYVETPYVEVWLVPELRWIPVGAMPFSLLLAVGAFTTSTKGGAAATDTGDPIRGVYAITRHPFLWAVALWSAAHLIANGDVGSILFFGGFLLLALLGPALIDRKNRRKGDKAWSGLAAHSSALPLAAAIRGRARVSLADLGWWRLGLTVLLYVVVVGAHPHIFGMPAWPV